MRSDTICRMVSGGGSWMGGGTTSSPSKPTLSCSPGGAALRFLIRAAS
jgi:hypothetical protein